MKFMVTGRRRSGTSYAEMQAHMLNVHGPLVIGGPDRQGAIQRYHQNHVVDAYYGAHTPYGRDMVAEVIFREGAFSPPQDSEWGRYFSDVVRPDEENFAEVPDCFPVAAREEELTPPPHPGSRDRPPEALKAFFYWARAATQSSESFTAALPAAESAILNATAALRRALKGHVRTWPFAALPPTPALTYDAVTSLWFARADGAKAVADFRRAAEDTALIDPARSFVLIVDEFRFWPK